MDIDCYALEVIARSRLAELRCNAARHRLVASLRSPRPGLWTALRSALQRLGRRPSGQKIVSPRPVLAWTTERQPTMTCSRVRMERSRSMERKDGASATVRAYSVLAAAPRNASGESYQVIAAPS